MPFPSDFENNICARARLCFGKPVQLLRQAAESVARRLTGAGHQALFAGGCVRDALLGREPDDYDIATSARPEEVLHLFPGSDEVGAHFGVIILHEGGYQFQVATFRSDGTYLDGRHPDSVTFNSNAEEDAKRRDFTINGLFEDPMSGKILDYVGGRKDLEAGILRAIGIPHARFEEDALRLLRALRFAIYTGFKIDPATWEALCADASLLQRVSPERIRDEFDKIITHSSRRLGVELLVESGLMEFIVPEFLALQGCEQPPQFHPEGDVYVHTLIMLELLGNSPSLELALSVMLHDIAKPPTFTVDETGRIRNSGHDRLGAHMTGEILRRLRYSNQIIDDASSMVANHMNFMNVQCMRTAKLKRFMARSTYENELELHRVDCSSSHGMLDNIEFLQAKADEFASEPLIPPPLVSGHDLIALGFEPGPLFSEILEFVQTEQLEGRLFERDTALAVIREKFVSD
ncbi:MAG: phosphohydrolase [Roseibacillus sp.]|jgi:poly(A) polymerase|nr:phosphohydrolase [Roseibacillus sp.]MBP36289.1 phosphohydrolase [Roseibacillus sp.]MCP4730122.1 CCA tRNA nucleotidyltransferase [Roseibacillus sp.]|tara:strand:- start:23119 stop:24507 length:1389 start_codon:yes stop_codon:yes gene_type:complete